jgi:hypothetical protein
MFGLSLLSMPTQAWAWHPAFVPRLPTGIITGHNKGEAKKGTPLNALASLWKLRFQKLEIRKKNLNWGEQDREKK